jgi:hypothetical protein
MINRYNILIGKHEGKRPLGKPRLRWEDNITLDRWEIGWEGVEWMHLAQDMNHWRAFVKMVMNFSVP